jgi:hypothetical protein
LNSRLLKKVLLIFSKAGFEFLCARCNRRYSLDKKDYLKEIGK